MTFDLIGWVFSPFLSYKCHLLIISRAIGLLVTFSSRKRPDGVNGAFRVHEGVWGLSWDNRGH